MCLLSNNDKGHTRNKFYLFTKLLCKFFRLIVDIVRTDSSATMLSMG